MTQQQLILNPNWAVPCHQCGAGTNEPCHSATGQIYPGYIHSARQTVLDIQPPTEFDYRLTLTDVDPQLKDSVAFQADRLAVEMILRKYGNVVAQG